MRGGIVLLVLGTMTIQVGASHDEPLTLVRSIELPHVEGRIDHLAFDAATERLYVAALGNNTVEVLDVRTDVHVRSLPGFREPQGIAVATNTRAVAVANGQGEGLQLLGADDYRPGASFGLATTRTTCDMTLWPRDCMSDSAMARWRRSIRPRASCSAR